tara:strand:- start:376 stop:1167 length:792 start_codon:yes stop_codon:yes gene_type:complete
MVNKYFTVTVKPDIVNGDISNIQQADTNDLDVGASDIIFNWTAVDMPKGSSKLVSVSAMVNAENGVLASGSLTNYELIFAKSVNGVAPRPLGVVNAVQTTGFNVAPHYVGCYQLSSTAGKGTIQLSRFYVMYLNASAQLYGGTPLVIDLDPQSGTNVGYDKLYVAGYQTSARHYSTGVIVDGAITSDTETTITVDGIDANKMFEVGDTVYLHDVDTALGTIKSIATDGLSITLNAAIAGGTNLDDDDELVNANPIKLILGFEK